MSQVRRQKAEPQTAEVLCTYVGESGVTSTRGRDPVAGGGYLGSAMSKTSFRILARTSRASNASCQVPVTSIQWRSPKPVTDSAWRTHGFPVVYV